MTGIRYLILAGAALMMAGCTTSYGELYPKPLHYRHGVPERNFGYGPLPIPNSPIPVRPKDWLPPNADR